MEEVPEIDTGDGKFIFASRGGSGERRSKPITSKPEPADEENS